MHLIFLILHDLYHAYYMRLGPVLILEDVNLNSMFQVVLIRRLGGRGNSSGQRDNRQKGKISCKKFIRGDEAGVNVIWDLFPLTRRSKNFKVPRNFLVVVLCDGFFSSPLLNFLSLFFCFNSNLIKLPPISFSTLFVFSPLFLCSIFPPLILPWMFKVLYQL